MARPGAFDGRASVDGVITPLHEARVPVTDRGLMLGDAVFDTVRTYDLRPFLLGDHLDRLRRSAAALELPVPWTDTDLAAVVAELLEDWPTGREATLRLMVTRGDGGHGLHLPEPQVPRLLVIARPLPRLPEAAYRHGVGVAVPTRPLSKDAAVPAHVKSANYLAGILALREARRTGAIEALLRAADGSWAEATTSNLFCVRDGAVHTPRLVDDILPGVTRALVLAVARAASLPISERRVDDADLFGADELFITSSIKEVVPVVRLDEAPVGDGAPGPVTRRVMDLFAAGVRRIADARASRLAEVFGAA